MAAPHRNQALDATTDAPSALALSRAGGGARGVKVALDTWLQRRGLTRSPSELHTAEMRRNRRHLPSPLCCPV